MGKPWARYEQNYINHPKFLALTSNAICLWLEGKNYCDMHQTDGLIPREALRTFRFNGSKSTALLMASCGLKPNGTPYAPLWESSDVGLKMHDYLDHNDCRDAVLKRIEAADERREKDRQRKAEARDEKARKSGGIPSGQIADGPRTVPRKVRSITETTTETETEGTEVATPIVVAS